MYGSFLSKGYEVLFNEGQLKSVRYRMSVYDDFLKEYAYRKKVKGVQRTEQKQQTRRNGIIADKKYMFLFVQEKIRKYPPSRLVKYLA